MVLRESQMVGTSATHRQAQLPYQEAGKCYSSRSSVGHTYQCRSEAPAIRDEQLRYERQAHMCSTL
jgi:hypothetical protein